MKTTWKEERGRVVHAFTIWVDAFGPKIMNILRFLIVKSWILKTSHMILLGMFTKDFWINSIWLKEVNSLVWRRRERKREEESSMHSQFESTCVCIRVMELWCFQILFSGSNLWCKGKIPIHLDLAFRGFWSQK